MHAGAFNVMANAGLAAELNDNVYATDDDARSDTILRFTPEIDARSNWNVHALAAGISVDHNEHLDESSETSTDYSAYVDGRLDVTRSFQLTGRVNAAQTTEPRYEPANNGEEPTQINRTGVTAGAQYTTDRLQLRGAVGTSDNNYSTDPLTLVDRDFTDNFLSGRVSYAFSPDFALFVQGRTSEQDYTDATRNGEQTSYEVGASFELSAPFRGEIAIGNVKEDKNVGQDLDGLSLDALVEWFPTQLTTVTFRGISRVFDPGLAASSSALNTNYSVRIDHELYRNIILFGEGGFGSYDYEGIDRQDDFTDFTVGGAWKLNKHARLEADYRMHNSESDGAAADPLRLDVSQNIFSVGIRVYP
jgi:hypothetical protein